MGLFCGKKCEQKRRCKSWFSALPSVERACKNAAKVDQGFTKEEFLCSGKWIDQQTIMLEYGYDPCLGDAINMGTVLDPTDTQGQVERDLENFMPVLYIGAGLLIIALAVLALIGTAKRK